MKVTSTHFVCAVSLAMTLSAVGIAGQGPQGPVMVGGRNVNINGGPSELSITPPVFTGDATKKMENEGHCSSNPLIPAHMICGFNEYKTVIDLPGLDPLTPLTRDAFLGIAQSTDFGNHWVSDLLPGSLLDSRTQPDGTPWPLKVEGFRAAADAVTATTPGGLAYVSGIFFKSLSGKGAVAVSTFIDPGNDEANPAPFQLVRQSILDVGAPVPGTSRFYDKPWMAVGPTAVGTCSVPVRAADGGTSQKTVPAHPVYVVSAAFTGVDPDDANTEQYFYRSLDCGATWSKGIKISMSAVNQAIALVVQPGTGHIYGVYRRFVDVNTTNAMMWVRSTDGGATFSTPQMLVEICSFTQGTSERTFRINTFPTLAAGPNGVFAAWSAKRRDPSGVCDTEGPALIQISSYNATSGWSSPVVVEDPAAAGPSLPGSHQIFPSMAFNTNHLGLIWYDFRNDLASLDGQPVRSPSGIVEPQGATATRHTVDVRGVLADLNQGLNPNGSPKFGPSAEISQYLTGVRAANPTALVKLQHNRPNMRMFRLAPGSNPRGVPFFSDYISLTPIQGATGSSGPLFYAAWTDTRDALSVNLPTTWTAPNWSIFGTNSLVDPTQTRPVCTVNPFAGVLDMNLYGAVVSKGGLFAYSPNSAKPLGATARTFLVIVRNSETSGPVKRVRLNIRANPTGGSALFVPEQAAEVFVDIPNISSITRTVEVKEDTNPHTVLAPNAPITVDVTDVTVGGTGQVLSIVLNGDPNALPPVNLGEESYTPDIPDDLQVNVTSATPEIDSPEIDSHEVDANALTPEIDSPEIDSSGIDYSALSPEIDSPEIDSAAITDVTYTYHNNGTAATSFRTRYVGDLDPLLYSVQLLIRDQYTTQASDCVPNQFQTNQVAVNVNVADITSASVGADSIQNASAFLRPGGTAIVTARIRSLAGAPPLTKEQARETFGLVVKADGKTRPTAALDHVKPRFTKRADIVVPSTTKDGAIVTFTNPSVLDRVDAVLGIPVTSFCASATGLTSGSLFPIGTTTILCTATDSHGNTATTDFTITVTKSKK